MTHLTATRATAAVAFAIAYLLVLCARLTGTGQANDKFGGGGVERMASRRQRDEWTEFMGRRVADLRGRVVDLARRLWGPARRGPPSGGGTEPKSSYPMTPGQGTMIGCLLVASAVIFAVAARTPIPSGKENCEKARPFLKELFPDREVSPSDSVTAPVAVVFHLIRSGEPKVARRAIEFATEQQFGYAAPYVIDRLDSDDPELERAAQNFLRTIAIGDHGPDTQSWRAWWRDPTRNILDVLVGRNTFAIITTVGMGLCGLFLMVLGRWLQRRTIAILGDGMLGLAWFMAFVHVMIRVFATSKTCSFGSSIITYFSNKGRVVGLEDAAMIDGKPGPIFLAMATFVLVPMLLMIGCHVFIARRRKKANLRADRAGIGQVAPPADREGARTG